ncbi:hypothetical protein V2O64_15765 [Verrucomicrobiaceae bacterium 227]
MLSFMLFSPRPLSCLSALCLLALSLPCLAGTFATYNIRYDNPGDAKAGNAWKTRGPMIASMIRFHDFDLVGTQEGLPHQMQDLKELLPAHQLITHGRDDGEEKGEHLGIFYRRDKFRAVTSGFFWLSETPEKASIGWDAALPRICTWARFEELAVQRQLQLTSTTIKTDPFRLTSSEHF